MQHQLALLLSRLNPHETHGRAPHRLTDCLRVGGIVLIALDVGLHILRWHQTDLVAQLRQLARPMVRRGTGLHADQAGRQSFEERYNLAAAKLLSDDDLLGRVNAVNLEHVLGDIQTDRGNLHVDGSPHVIRLRRTTLWHCDAGSGRRPPHQQETHALQQNIITVGPAGPAGNMLPIPRSYSILTATLNVLPLTVCSCNVAALWRLPGSVLLVTGSVIVAIAPISARSPNGLGAKRL